MAQLDHTIYFQQSTPDIVGGIERGLRMSDMIKQRKKQRDLEDAYKAGVTIGEDGSVKVDKGLSLKALVGSGNAQEALGLSKEIETEKQAKQKLLEEKRNKGFQIFGNVYNQIKDQDSYSKARNLFIQNGFDPSEIPEVYNKKEVDFLYAQSVPMIERLKQDQIKTDMAKSKNDMNNSNQRLSLDKRKFEFEMSQPKMQEQSLPLDSKKMVEALSTKNANKLAIKNQIDSVMGMWDTLSEDDKVRLGGQLLKTLNSPEGADAIGAEEANRLGAALEFSYGNFLNSNPTQFGRNLEGFKNQAVNTSQSLGTAVNLNQGIIDEKMGRPKQVEQNTTKPKWAK